MNDWFLHFDDNLWLKNEFLSPERARFIKRALHLRK